jgi:hypothetical protein
MQPGGDDWARRACSLCVPNEEYGWHRLAVQQQRGVAWNKFWDHTLSVAVRCKEIISHMILHNFISTADSSGDIYMPRP